jgi:hypothetical protein
LGRAAFNIAAFGSLAFTGGVMLDVIFVMAGLAFFAVAIGYTLICEKL